MSESHSEATPMDDLAEEFARRLRAGEYPAAQEYIARYPDKAEELRAMLSAVVMMEQFKPRRDEVRPGKLATGPEGIPERIGECRIIREIGRGGMGVVYEADQIALGRRVAVKVLAGNLLADERLRTRFRREAQAAARLHHTNIVPVFGVGDHEGLCYYTMQLINGRGLDQIIRETTPRSKEEDKDATTPDTTAPVIPTNGTADVESTNRTTCDRAPNSTLKNDFHTIANIGIQVSDALAHAHAQGVLHRDIKPSNLILDTMGIVWVTDFGVAKLVEEANLTQSGDLVGTLKYMPPERFSGQSDARGDIYSLGVTLYEMITCRSAFPDTTPQHLIRLITQESPSPPRKVNPDVPADLETIILKASARDPAHRYQTPGELAEDLRRFLTDRPILARRTTLWEQTYRWCRRNVALAGALASAFVLMIAITIISVVAYVRTAAANEVSAQALASEKTQRQHAQMTSTLALQALNRTYERFAPTRLVATPESVNEEGVALPLQPALPPEGVSLLEDLQRTYEQIAQSAGEFPKLRAQAAEANHRIGDIRQRLGQFDAAASAYRNAIDLYGQLPASSAGDTTLIKIARAYNELGRSLIALHQFEEGGKMHERAVRTLTNAPTAFAARPECRYELACSYLSLGVRNMFLTAPPPGKGGGGGPGSGRFERGGGPPWERGGKGSPHKNDHEPPPPPGEPSPGVAGEHPAQKAASILEELVRDFPSVPEYRHLLACCYRDTPPERFGRRLGGGHSNLDRGVTLLRQLVKDFPQVPDYRLDLCEALAHRGPPNRGKGRDFGSSQQANVQEAINLSGELVKQYPNVPRYTAAHARYLDNQGMRLLQIGKIAESESAHRKAVTLQTRLVKQYPEVSAYGFWLGLMQRSLGKALSEKGELKEAKTLLSSAIIRVEGLRKKDTHLLGVNMFMGIAYRDLAQTLTRLGETSQASEALKKAERFGKPFGGGFEPGPPNRRPKG